MKLRNIATVQMGYSFRSRLETTAGGDVAVIQMKDLADDNTVDCNNLAKIELDSLKKHHLTQHNDLIFRSRGHTLTAAILLSDPGKAVVAAPLLRIRVTKLDRILPAYLNWYLRQQDAQIYLTSCAKGTAQKMISKQTLDGLEVALPPLPIQAQIVTLAKLATHEQHLLHTLANKRKQYINATLRKLTKGDSQ